MKQTGVFIFCLWMAAIVLPVKQDRGAGQRVDVPLVTEVQKLLPEDGDAGDNFGSAIAIHGDIVVVGAHHDDEKGDNSGSAYIFYRNQGGSDNWGQVAKLTASDGSPNDLFGCSVAISGNTVVVGAREDNTANGTQCGSAYIFYRNQGGSDNWGEVTKLTAADGSDYDHFGTVAIDGDTVAVGAYKSVYIFYRNQGGSDNWGQVTKLTTADGDSGDQFGWSLGVQGDTLVVGAPGDHIYSSGSGSAYIFYRNQGGPDNWGRVTRVIPGDGGYSDLFATSVAVSGSRIVVGARFGDGVAANTGAAYVFYKNRGGTDNWGQEAKLFAPHGGGNDRFGESSDISGDKVVVGASLDDNRGINSGSIYTFHQHQGGSDNWGQLVRQTATDGSAGDTFGCAVSIYGSTMAVGAVDDDDQGGGSGSAYILEFRDLHTSDVAVYKEVDNAAPANGQEVTFTISAVNNGPYDTSLVEVADRLPPGLVYVSSTPSKGSYNFNSGRWAIGSLQSNEQASLAITALVSQSGAITNTALKTCHYGIDDNGGNDSASVTLTARPSFQVTVKSTAGGHTDKDGSKWVAEGEQITITAMPDTGYRFVGWSGHASGGENPLLIIVNSPLTIVAHFVNEPPTVTITSPAQGAAVRGIVKVKAVAADDSHIKSVSFYVDGRLLHTVTTAPYHYSWDSTFQDNGAHKLKAVARDYGDKKAQAVITVHVDNVTIHLDAARRYERAWLIRRQYGDITFTVQNSDSIAVANCLIEGKQAAGAFQIIREVPAADITAGSYTHQHLLPLPDIAYTYRVTAVDGGGLPMGRSKEKTI